MTTLTQLRRRRTARAKGMAALFREGKTLQEIATTYGLSRERVRQLLAGIGITRHDGGAAKQTADRRIAAAAVREQIYLAKYGFTPAEYQQLPKRARRAFFQQRQAARSRGILWCMTMAQWWHIWAESGKWEARGPGTGYCMARNGDIGPYAPDNVYICTIGQNFSDSYRWKPAHMRRKRPSKLFEYLGQQYSMRALADLAAMSPSALAYRLGRGWSIDAAVKTPLKLTAWRRRSLSKAQACGV